MGSLTTQKETSVHKEVGREVGPFGEGVELRGGGLGRSTGGYRTREGRREVRERGCDGPGGSVRGPGVGSKGRISLSVSAPAGVGALLGTTSDSKFFGPQRSGKNSLQTWNSPRP